MVDLEESAGADDALPGATRRSSARPGRLRRWTRRLAWLGLFGALVLVALYLTRDRLLHPALCRLATWGGARAGYDVRIARLDTDWWREFSVEGIDVRASSSSGPLRALELDVARATFSVPTLVRAGLAGVADVKLGRGRIELDVRGGASENGEAEGSGEFSLPETLPRIAAESVELLLETDAGRLAVDGVQAAMRGATYSIAATRVDWSGGVQVTTPAAVQIVWGAGGRVAFSGLDLGSAVRAGTGEVDLRRLGEGALELAVTLELPEDGHASARLSLVDGALAVTLEESRIALAPTIAAVASVGLPTPGIETLAGVADLRGELRAGAGTSGFEARLRLDGRDVVYEGRQTDSLVAEATLRPEGIRFDRVEARRADQVVVVTDTTLPFADLVEGLSGTVQVDVNDLARWIRGAADPGEAGAEVPPHRLVLRGEVGGGGVRLDEGRLDVAGGHIDLRSGTLDLVPPAAGERRLDLDLNVDLPELSALGELLGATDWGGRLSGEVRLSGPLEAPVGRAQLEGADVAIAGVQLGALTVDAESDGKEVRIARLSARSDAVTAEVSGIWRIQTQSLVDASVNLDVGGLEAFGFDPGGVLSAVARLDGPWNAPTGTLEVSSSDLAVAGTALEDVVLDARADEGVVTVTRAGARTPYGEVDLSGTGTVAADGRIEFVLATLVASAGASDLRLVNPARLTSDSNGFLLERLELAGTAGRLVTEARLDAGAWSGRLDAAALRLDAFLASLLPEGTSLGTIDAALTLDPDASLRFAGGVTEVVAAPEALSGAISVEGVWREETVELASLTIALDGRDVLSAHGRIPLPHLRPDAPLELEARAELRPDFPVAFPLRGKTARFTGDGQATVSLGGTWRVPRGTVSLVGRDLLVEPPELVRPYLGDPAAVNVVLELGDDTALTRLEVTLPDRLVATGSGKLSGPLDLARLARGDLEGLRAGSLDAKGIVTLSDPSWAAELLGARRLGGSWRADVTLRGSIAAPRVAGNVAVQAGSIKFAGVPELENLALDLAVSTTGVVIRDARGELGSSELRVTGKVDRAESGPVFDVALTGENVLLQRSSKLRLRGDLALALAGPLDALALTGDVHLVNSRFLQQIDILSVLDVRSGGGVTTAQRGLVLPSFRDGPLASMRLDVDVDTREPLSLLGNVARGKIGLDLNLGGTGEVLIPTGTVFLDEGRVALPGGPMRFDRGLVTFREEDPYVPRLDLSGEARLAGYDLELRIEGPLDDLQIEPAAFPPLDRRDALLLVLTGTVPPSGEATSTAAQSLGLYLAKDLARRWTSNPTLSDSDDEGLLERIQLVSGQDVSRSGVMTLEVSYRAFDELFAESDSIFVVGERDIYEDYNIGLRFLFRSR